MGLAQADVARGYNQRAAERFESALGLMQRLEPSPPEEVLAEVRGELARLNATQ